MTDPVLFERVDAHEFVASDATRGPWFPNAQHGSPPAALFAHELHRLELPVPMNAARITIELLRPVPVAKLSLHAELVRPGKRVAYAEAVMRDGDTEVAKAAAWFIAAGTTDIWQANPTLPAPDMENVRTRPNDVFTTSGFHSEGMQFIPVVGAFEEPGPATFWLRLIAQVVAGEPIHPVSRVMAAADFGNGVGAILDQRQWFYVNTDATVYLSRPPDGEWIALEAETIAGPSGAAIAEARLHDASGALGRSVQTLMVAPR